MPFRLLVPRPLLDEMVAQARAELPNECCGFLAGKIEDRAGELVGMVEKRYGLVNELASPTEYLSDPKSLFAAHRDMNSRGLEILAVYHSHPTSAPIPSKKDLAQNYSEIPLHLIISLQSEPVEVRGWTLADGKAHAVAWKILEMEDVPHAHP